MSEMRHTPGPWTIDDEIVKPKGNPERICRVRHGQHVVVPDVLGTSDVRGNKLANARLIAAAPDLAEAAMAIRDDGYCPRWRDALIAALAKAGL